MDEMTYLEIMQLDFPKDFTEEDEFTAALLDLCENSKENDK